MGENMDFYQLQEGTASNVSRGLILTLLKQAGEGKESPITVTADKGAASLEEVRVTLKELLGTEIKFTLEGSEKLSFSIDGQQPEFQRLIKDYTNGVRIAGELNRIIGPGSQLLFAAGKVAVDAIPAYKKQVIKLQSNLRGRKENGDLLTDALPVDTKIERSGGGDSYQILLWVPDGVTTSNADNLFFNLDKYAREAEKLRERMIEGNPIPGAGNENLAALSQLVRTMGFAVRPSAQDAPKSNSISINANGDDACELERKLRGLFYDANAEIPGDKKFVVLVKVAPQLSAQGASSGAVLNNTPTPYDVTVHYIASAPNQTSLPASPQEIAEFLVAAEQTRSKNRNLYQSSRTPS